MATSMITFDGSSQFQIIENDAMKYQILVESKTFSGQSSYNLMNKYSRFSSTVFIIPHQQRFKVIFLITCYLNKKSIICLAFTLNALVSLKTHVKIQ